MISFTPALASLWAIASTPASSAAAKAITSRRRSSALRRRITKGSAEPSAASQAMSDPPEVSLSPQAPPMKARSVSKSGTAKATWRRPITPLEAMTILLDSLAIDMRPGSAEKSQFGIPDIRIGYRGGAP